MSQIPLQKILILSPLQSKDRLVEMLENAGVISLRRLSPEQARQYDLSQPKESASDIEAALFSLENAIEFVANYMPKKSFFDSLINARPIISNSFYNESCKQFDHHAAVNRIKDYEIKMDTLLNRENQIKENIKLLEGWDNLDFPIMQVACGKRWCSTIGAIKTKSLLPLREKLGKLSPHIHIEIVSQTHSETRLFIVYMPYEEKIVREFLSLNEFSQTALPNSPLTPKDEKSALLKSLFEVKTRIAELGKEIASMQEVLLRLKCVYDCKFIQKNIVNGKNTAFTSKRTFGMVGWIKKSDLNRLSNRMQSELGQSCLVELIDKDKDERIPTYIENPPLLQPFETVTRLSGMPAAHDMDPTLPLSAFFIVFFGFCLGDVAYGLILSIACFFMLKNDKISIGGKKLIGLLLIGGIASIFAGIITGSWFGDALNYAPALKSILLPLQLIDPIKNPLAMLIFSLILGIIQILFGILLRGIHHLRQGYIAVAIMDDFSWLFYLASLVGLVVLSFTRSNHAHIFAYASIAFAIILVVTQGRSSKGPMKLISGLLSLYGTTAYLGDVLSYSRILALGMSTTIIAMVINILSSMVKDSLPIIGFIFMFALFVVGHLLNLVLGVLGSFIHSARLQLVEFFGKFYEGGGEEFKPFQRSTKYLTIKES